MKSKIFRTTLSVTMITLLVCMGFVITLVYSFFENNYTVELKNEAQYIASSIEVYGAEYIENVDFGDLRVSYIKKDGTVLFDSRADVATMENHRDREEFEEAIKTGYGDSARLSQTLSEKTYYIARLLPTGDVIRVSDTRHSELALVSRLVMNIVIAMLLSVVLSIVFSRRLARMVVKPINEINLSEPQKAEVYEELTPLLEKITKQNRLINEQMELLIKEREEFSSITSNMSEGFIVIDMGTNILSSNTAATELLSGKKSIGEGSVYNLNRQEAFIKCVDASLSGKHENVVLCEKGRFIRVLASPVYDTGHVIGALLILMDVTEREGRDVLRREFTANVSHELKTPLTSISAAAEMILGGMVKDEDIKSFSEKIYCEAQRLISLVNDIIKLSKLDEGGSVIEFEEHSAKQLTEDTVKVLYPLAEAKNITIHREIDDFKLNCIKPLYEEIVYNLMDNAIKYTPEGGNVKISLKHTNDNVILTVEDNGIGISISEQERVFERFYRGDKSHNGKVSGTGLGLSIVKHAVILHKGTIKLESEEGKGSRFIVVI
ncbi:MAG: histidine kinase [Clostridia bacterium]|nr:histidine kinase [Clostridia bacterium]